MLGILKERRFAKDFLSEIYETKLVKNIRVSKLRVAFSTFKVTRYMNDLLPGYPHINAMAFHPLKTNIGNE